MGSNRRGYNGVWFIFCISTLVCAGRSLDAPGPSLPIGGLLHRRRIFASRWARTAEGTTAFGSSFVFQLSCAQAGVWMHPVHPYLSGVFSIAGEYSPLRAAWLQRARRYKDCCAGTTLAWSPCQISNAGCWMARANENANAQGNRNLNLTLIA